MSTPSACRYRPHASALITLLLLVGVAAAAESPADIHEELSSVVASAQVRDARHRDINSNKWRQTMLLFQAMADEHVTDQRVAALAEPLRFRLAVLRDDQEKKVRVLSEQADAHQGRGVYAVRLASQLPLAIQAPHGFFDRRTRELATQMFLSCDALAAAWNSTHRSHIDVAHERRHEFHCFTETLASIRQLSVVQLHGFAAKSRATASARRADVIVSNGTRSPQLFTRRLTDSLQLAFPGWQVRLYPWSVNELGATTNVQALALRSSPHDFFVSLELNSDVRRQLAGDIQITARLAEAVTIAVRQFTME